MNILFTFYPHGDWFYYIKKDSQCQYALFFYYIEIFLYDIICQTHQVLHEYYQI